MPKSLISVETLVENWISFYNKVDHIIFTTDGSVMFCQLSDKKISIRTTR